MFIRICLRNEGFSIKIKKLALRSRASFPSLMSQVPSPAHLPHKKRISLDIHTGLPNLGAPVRIDQPDIAVSPVFARKSLDGVQGRPSSLLIRLRKQSLEDSLWRLWRKYEIGARRVRRIIAATLPEFAPRKLFYGSLSGGVALGMIGMGFVGQLSGPDVSARSSEAEPAAVTETVAEREMPPYNLEKDIFFEYFNEATEEAYEANVRKMVAGHPIEEMLPYIFEKDHLVAAFLVGIAKKESNWGKRVPVLAGQDCFNYWGYRGIRKMMGTGGHTCFNSRKDAVDTVAKRLETLIHSQKLDTPEKMIIWKCGYSCEGHSRESVKKWIADVDMYFREASYE